jgi:hypothetical protein
MTVHQNYPVNVLIGLDKASVQTSAFPQAGTTTIVTVPYGHCTLTVTLTGEAFDITATSSATQSFIETRVLTWSWQVAPKRTGPALLLIVVIQPSVEDSHGGLRAGHAQTIKETIVVSSKPETFPALVLRKADDVVTNDVFKWLFPSAAVFIGSLVWLRMRGRKSAPPTDVARTGAVEETSVSAAGKHADESGGPKPPRTTPTQQGDHEL